MELIVEINGKLYKPGDGLTYSLFLRGRECDEGGNTINNNKFYVIKRHTETDINRTCYLSTFIILNEYEEVEQNEK